MRDQLTDQSGTNLRRLLASLEGQQAGWLMRIDSMQNTIHLQFTSRIACDTYCDFFTSQCPGDVKIKIEEEEGNFNLTIHAGDSADLANLLNNPSPEKQQEYLLILNNLYANKFYTSITSRFNLTDEALAAYLSRLNMDQLIRCERLLSKTTGVKINSLQQYFSDYLAASIEVLTLHDKLCHYFKLFCSRKLMWIRIEPNNFISLRTGHPILKLALEKVLHDLKMVVEKSKDNGLLQINIPFSVEKYREIINFLDIENKKKINNFMEYMIAYLQIAITSKIELVNVNEEKLQPIERGLLVHGLEGLLASLNSDSNIPVQFSNGECHAPLSVDHVLISYDALGTYSSTGKRRATLNQEIRASFLLKMGDGRNGHRQQDTAQLKKQPQKVPSCTS